MINVLPPDTSPENGFEPKPSCAAFIIGSCISVYIRCNALKPPGRLCNQSYKDSQIHIYTFFYFNLNTTQFVWLKPNWCVCFQ